MNIFKGLLIKDFLQLKSYKKNFFLSIFIYATLIFMNSDQADMGLVGSIMIMFLFSIYAMSTFNYDEKSKADRYILTFPLTKKEVVLSKYLIGIISLLLGALIGMILGIGIMYISTKTLPDLESILSGLLGGAIALSFMQAIQIPSIYKYGAEKGRLQIYIIMLIIALIPTGIYWLSTKIDLNINVNFVDFFNKAEPFLPFVALALIVLNYFISYKVSYKIYSKKEV